MALALLYCHAPSSRAEPVRISIAVTGSGALSAVGARDICSDVLPLPAAKRSDHPRRLNPSLWSSFPNEWCKTAALLLDSASAWRRSFQLVLLGIRYDFPERGPHPTRLPSVT